MNNRVSPNLGLGQHAQLQGGTALFCGLVFINWLLLLTLSQCVSYSFHK